MTLKTDCNATDNNDMAQLFNELSIKKNRLYCEDCFTAIQKLIDEHIKVDLIYLDPPFNSNRVYNMIFRRGGVSAQQKAFDDTWFTRTKTEQLILQFETILETAEIDRTTKLFLQAWLNPLKEQSTSADRKLISYIIYMTERLIMMREILSDEGSIYFHCDPTASHYIKIIMDGIFGRNNFVNEIVWCYRGQNNKKAKKFQSRHDIIFFYKKSDSMFFNVQYGEPTKESKKTYESGERVGYIANHSRMMAVVFDWDKYNQAVANGKIPKGMRTKEFDGGNPTLNDWWQDIKILGGPNNRERLGYDTQKPIKLLDRIIKASCPPDGIVLDPFCGCGTTIEAAVNNEVKWIGIDISNYALDIIKARLNNNKGIGEDKYDYIIDNPKTIEEYKKMDAYEKQDFSIKAVGGMPNRRKSGDGGIDGEMTIHLGFDEQGKDTWGKMVFSVKSGKQHNPAHVRELIGTMNSGDFVMGGLIIDCDPTPKMEEAAEKAGVIKYNRNTNKELPPDIYNKVQILTIDDIVNRKQLFDTPPTLAKVKAYRDTTGQLQW